MLNFPKNPQEGDVYDYPPFKYIFTSGRWQTVGRGADTVAESIKVHAEGVGVHPVSGIDWQGSIGHRNLLINGDFCIAARAQNTRVVNNTPNVFVCDRWRGFPIGGDATFVATFANTWPGPFKSLMSIQTHFNAQTSGTYGCTLQQYIESRNVSLYVGAKATLSMVVYTENSGTRIEALLQAAGNIDDWSTKETVGTQTKQIPANQWTNVSFTFDINNQKVKNGMLVDLFFGSQSIADGKYLFVSNVQLEVGEIATPFEHRPYGYELALCQRYWRPAGTVMSFLSGDGAWVPFNVDIRGMRIIPQNIQWRVSRMDSGALIGEWGTITPATFAVSGNEGWFNIQNSSNKPGTGFALNIQYRNLDAEL